MKLSILSRGVLVLVFGLVNSAMAQNDGYNTLSVHNEGNTAVTVHVQAHGHECHALIFDNIKPGTTQTQNITDNTAETEAGLQTQCSYGSADFYQTESGANWGSAPSNQDAYPGHYPINHGPTLWVNNSEGGHWGIGVQS